MTELQKPQAEYLKDYQAPHFSIEHTELTFDLQPLKTQVNALLTLKRVGDLNAPLVLDGIDLTLISLSVEGAELTDYKIINQQLIINNLPNECQLSIVTQTSPQTNTSLEGLYL